MSLSSSPDSSGRVVDTIPVGRYLFTTRLLEKIVHPEHVLKEAGYILEQLSPGELETQRKCNRCFRSPRFGVEASRSWRSDKRPSSTRYSEVEEEETFQIGERPVASGSLKRDLADGICLYHDGKRVHGVWTCCFGHAPCKGLPSHSPKHALADAKLASHWKFHTTPKPAEDQNVREVVALIMQIGVSMEREPEVISLTLLDYFTDEVLISKYVWPECPMLHYNTGETGISYEGLLMAKKEGKFIRGSIKARQALHEFIGPDTIIMGEGLHHGLRALRLIHKRIVDTKILASGSPSWQKVTDKLRSSKDKSSEGSSRDSFFSSKEAPGAVRDMASTPMPSEAEDKVYFTPPQTAMGTPHHHSDQGYRGQPEHMPALWNTHQGMPRCG